MNKFVKISYIINYTFYIVNVNINKKFKNIICYKKSNHLGFINI